MAPPLQQLPSDDTTAHRVHVDPDTGHIHIRARRNPITVVFFTLFLAGWTTGGIQILAGPMTAFALIWVAMWAFVVIMTALTLLGMMCSVDIVRVEAGLLVIRRRAGIVQRTWQYETSAIRNLRIDLQRVTGRTAPNISSSWRSNGAPSASTGMP